MERALELFDAILKDAQAEVFRCDPENVKEFAQKLKEIGEESTTLNRICDGVLLSSLISSVVVGNVLTMLGIPGEVISEGIQNFEAAHPDIMYLILGCLSFVKERGLNFEGEEFVEIGEVGYADYMTEEEAAEEFKDMIHGVTNE